MYTGASALIQPSYVVASDSLKVQPLLPEATAKTIANPRKRPAPDVATPVARRPTQLPKQIAPTGSSAPPRTAPQTKRSFQSPFARSPYCPGAARNSPSLPPSAPCTPIIDQVKCFSDVLSRIYRSASEIPPVHRIVDPSLLSVTSGVSGLTLIALRFSLARFYSSLVSLGDEPLSSVAVPSSLLSLSKAGEGIYTAVLSSDEEVHFVEHTGEPIGTEKKGPKARISDGLVLRPDWHAYLSQEGGVGKRLVERVQTSDGETYPTGISRRFLTLAAGCPELLQCAESYVLANSAVRSRLLCQASDLLMGAFRGESQVR